MIYRQTLLAVRDLLSSKSLEADLQKFRGELIDGQLQAQVNEVLKMHLYEAYQSKPAVFGGELPGFLMSHDNGTVTFSMDPNSLNGWLARDVREMGFTLDESIPDTYICEKGEWVVGNGKRIDALEKRVDALEQFDGK